MTKEPNRARARFRSLVRVAVGAEGAASLDGGLAWAGALFVATNDWDGRGGRLIRLDP